MHGAAIVTFSDINVKDDQTQKALADTVEKIETACMGTVNEALSCQ